MPSVSRMSRKCGIHDVSQPQRHPRSVLMTVEQFVEWKFAETRTSAILSTINLTWHIPDIEPGPLQGESGHYLPQLRES
jgi:hypothetical protein